VEVNRQVWLAALGLIARTQKSAGPSLRSVKSLDALIKVGETLEENARDLIERSASLAKKRIAASSDAMDSQLRKLEELVDDRVAAALDRMGLPTVRVLDQLIKKVEALQAQVIGKTS
jgi:poly(hydroxyalkanoate) granule-associated protein